MSKVAVIGAGSWGTAISSAIADADNTVHIYGRESKNIEEINAKHTNEQFLPGVVLNSAVIGTTDIAQAIDQADIIVLGVPTNAIRSVAGQIRDLLANKPIIVSLAKGLEQKTDMRVSQVLEQVLNPNSYEDIVVLSGPSHAEEVAQKQETSVTVASTKICSAQKVQRTFSNDYFRLYTNPDMIGVEIAGALKNVIALAAGILRGLGRGDNATAALLTRGLAEISRFGVALGANPFTFMGLSGMGDLIVTATSEHSRNFTAGREIGRGEKFDDVLSNMGMVVEGAYTVKVAHEMSRELKVEMPITNSLYSVLYEGASPEKEITRLMNRDSIAEINND